MKKLLVICLGILAVGMFAMACSSGGGGGGCKSNADCASQGANFYCNLSSGSCECAPQCTGKCCGDDGCGGTCANNCAAGTTCNQTSCACEGGGCTSDLDCSVGQTCNNGTCVATGCTSDADCGTGQTCNNGTCVASGCTSDADCGTGQTCNNGTCVATGCTSDAQCPNGQVCQNGSCVVSGCTSDAQCPTNYACQNGSCVFTGCTSDADCGNGEVCTNGTCVVSGCTSDAQCPTFYACQNGSCVYVGCTQDAQCPTGQVCTNGDCVPSGCTQDADCPTGQVCTNGACVDQGGAGAGEPCKCEAADSCSIPCGASAPVCLTTDDQGNGFCTLECTTDGNCTAVPAFSDGCCFALADGSACVPGEYCPGDQQEGQPCAWDTINANAGTCDADMTCLGNDSAGACSQVADCTGVAPEWNPECVGGNCGFSFCSALCGANRTCNTGFIAQDVGADCFCIPGSYGNAQAGEPCASTPTPDADDCAEGLTCLYSDTVSFCSHECADMSGCSEAAFSGGCCVDIGSGSLFCLSADFCG